jgi:hypothetical protein
MQVGLLEADEVDVVVPDGFLDGVEGMGRGRYALMKGSFSVGLSADSDGVNCQECHFPFGRSKPVPGLIHDQKIKNTECYHPFSNAAPWIWTVRFSLSLFRESNSKNENARKTETRQFMMEKQGDRKTGGIAFRRRLVYFSAPGTKCKKLSIYPIPKAETARTRTFHRYAALSQNAQAVFDRDNRLAPANPVCRDLGLGGEEAGPGRALADLRLPRPMRHGLQRGLPEVRDTGETRGFSWDEGAEVDHRRYQCRILPGPDRGQAVVEVREESSPSASSRPWPPNAWCAAERST